MKKKKLKLERLEVDSFVTTEEFKRNETLKIKGGIIPITTITPTFFGGPTKDNMDTGCGQGETQRICTEDWCRPPEILIIDKKDADKGPDIDPPPGWGPQ